MIKDINCDKKYILDCTSNNVEPFMYDRLDDIQSILHCIQTDLNRCCILRIFDRYMIVGKKK